MKITKFIIGAIALVAMFSCEKHELLYEGNHDVPAGDALFHICYFESLAKTTSNYIDSVYVNDVFYGGVGGFGRLAVENLLPTAGARYFTAKAGVTNIKLFRKDVVVYDKNVTLSPGKQDIYVTDLTLDAAVVPMTEMCNTGLNPTLENYGTDSTACVRLVNLLFEIKDNAYVPTQRALQYQWRDRRDEKDPETGDYHWKNLGEPVLFGECTAYDRVTVAKTVYNSSGYCTVFYRAVDANDGTVILNDYWTNYIGRAYDHVIWGIYPKPLTGDSNHVKVEYQQFTML